MLGLFLETQALRCAVGADPGLEAACSARSCLGWPEGNVLPQVGGLALLECAASEANVARTAAP